MDTEKKPFQGRGQLTDRIKKRSVELLGYEITKRELRLLPYLGYQLQNEQRLDPRSLDREEMDSLAKWVAAGYILEGVATCGRPMMGEGFKLKVTKKFWDILSQIIWLGYVDLNEESPDEE